MNTHKKKASLVFILFVVFLVYVTIISILSSISKDKDDMSALAAYFTYVNENICDTYIDPETLSDYTIGQIVRANNLVMSDVDNVSKLRITSVDQMQDITDKFDFSNTSQYVKGYILKCLYQWFEFSIDENSDDYWQLKYTTSHNVAVYTYVVTVDNSMYNFYFAHDNKIMSILNVTWMWLIFTITVYNNIRWHGKDRI